MLQRKMNAASELYQQGRRFEHKLLRKKKRQHEKLAIEDMKRCFDRNDVRNFSQKWRQTCHGYKARTDACRDENGRIVVESQSMLRIWRNYFSKLLNGDDEQNSTVRQHLPFQADNDDREPRPPDLENILIAITRLKFNKAAS